MKKSYSQRQKRIESRGDRIFSGVNAAILILLCIVTLYPIWYVLCASFTSNTYLVSHPGMILWPHEFTLGAYKLALTHPLLLSGYKNILIVLCVSLPINILLTLFTGYFMASKKMMFKPVIQFLILFTMFFSGGMIPSYLNIRSLGSVSYTHLNSSQAPRTSMMMPYGKNICQIWKPTICPAYLKSVRPAMTDTKSVNNKR